ncbi:hypothetical protein M8494_35360 [Serratia ureilytica]
MATPSIRTTNDIKPVRCSVVARGTIPGANQPALSIDAHIMATWAKPVTSAWRSLRDQPEESRVALREGSLLTLLQRAALLQRQRAGLQGVPPRRGDARISIPRALAALAPF